MQDGRFERDDAKADANRHKHGVQFEIARHVFDDPNGFDETDNGPDELRWKRVGQTSRGMLAVIYTERAPRTRIIAARRATRHEQGDYHRQAFP